MYPVVVEEPKKVVSSIPGLFSNSDLANKAVDTFDVLICGGTLGIFIATALCFKGLRVGIVERNVLKGVRNCSVKFILEYNVLYYELLMDILVINDQREQEWNISRKELMELVEIGVLLKDDIEQVTAAKFNPVSSLTTIHF